MIQKLGTFFMDVSCSLLILIGVSILFGSGDVVAKAIGLVSSVSGLGLLGAIIVIRGS